MRTIKARVVTPPPTAPMIMYSVVGGSEDRGGVGDGVGDTVVGRNTV